MPAQPLAQQPDDRIKEFFHLLQQGIDSWEKAGRLLHELHQERPGVLAEIIRQKPSLTFDMLLTLERVGKRTLHPRLLLNAGMPVKRLMAFTYEDQARLCEEPVEVVIGIKNGKPIVEKKHINEMSRFELKRVLDFSRLRTIKEQVEIYHAPNQSGNAQWQEMSRRDAAVKLRRMMSPNAAHSSPPDADPIPANQKVVGRWAIRKTIGNNCGFERTQARPPTVIHVPLIDGVAVIEVCEAIEE